VRKAPELVNAAPAEVLDGILRDILDGAAHVLSVSAGCAWYRSAKTLPQLLRTRLRALAMRISRPCIQRPSDPGTFCPADQLETILCAPSDSSGAQTDQIAEVEGGASAHAR
jgi:hypothetical protein